MLRGNLEIIFHHCYLWLDVGDAENATVHGKQYTSLKHNSINFSLGRYFSQSSPFIRPLASKQAAVSNESWNVIRHGQVPPVAALHPRGNSKGW